MKMEATVVKEKHQPNYESEFSAIDYLEEQNAEMKKAIESSSNHKAQVKFIDRKRKFDK